MFDSPVLGRSTHTARSYPGTRPAEPGDQAVTSWVPLHGADATPHGEGRLVVRGWSRVLARGLDASTGRLRVDATLTEGPGFGVFVRTALDGDPLDAVDGDIRVIAAGWSVQVDPGYGHGVLSIRRWHDDWESHPVATAPAPRELLRGRNVLDVEFGSESIRARWGDVVVGTSLTDAGARLGRSWAGVDGDRVGLRTWGGTVLSVRSLTVGSTCRGQLGIEPGLPIAG